MPSQIISISSDWRTLIVLLKALVIVIVFASCSIGYWLISSNDWYDGLRAAKSVVENKLSNLSEANQVCTCEKPFIENNMCRAYCTRCGLEIVANQPEK